MGSDTLRTSLSVANDDSIENEIGFSLCQKTCMATGHLLGCSGDVNTILKFIEWFEIGKGDYREFKPKGKVSIIDWDGKNLVSWWTDEQFSFFRMFLGLVTWNTDKAFKMVLKREVQDYDENEDVAYTIGSGEDFVSTAFGKIAFQFDRHKEKISDHLTREEVIKYCIVLASKHDPFTNDKINITSVSPQNASLSKG